MDKWIVIGIVAFCACMGAVGQLFFKLGSKPLSPIKLLIGLVLYSLATLLYIYMLRFGELSVLYPVISLSYILVMILSVVFLAESFTYLKLVGTSIIIFGVFLIVK